MHRRAKGTTPYDYGHDRGHYPLDRILAAAELASLLKPDAVPALRKLLADDDSAVRYWAALGLLMRGPKAVGVARADLTRRVSDPAPSTRIVAAEALARYGDKGDLKKALAVLLDHANAEKHGIYAAVQALNAIDALGERAGGIKEELPKLPRKDPKAPPRANDGYVANLVAHIVARK